MQPLKNRPDFSRWYTILNTRFLSYQSIWKLQVATSNDLGDAFTRKYIISRWTLT